MLFVRVTLSLSELGVICLINLVESRLENPFHDINLSILLISAESKVLSPQILLPDPSDFVRPSSKTGEVYVLAYMCECFYERMLYSQK